MPRLACPHCQFILTAAEEQRGQVLPCPGCQRSIKFPAPVSAVQARPPAPALGPACDAVQQKGPGRKERRRPVDDEADLPDKIRLERPRPKRKRKSNLVVQTVSLMAGLGVAILVITGGLDLVLEGAQSLFTALGIGRLAAFLLSGVALLIVGLFCMASLIKFAVLRSIPGEMHFLLVRRRDFPSLDLDLVDDYTEQFEALGFRRLEDVRHETDLDNGLSAYARLFYHDQEHCYAEINQVFKQDVPAALLGFNICTMLDDGWTVASGSRRPSAASYLLRRPRALWRSLPDGKPKELFRAHLSLRDDVTEALQTVAIIGSGDPEVYFEHQRKAAAEWKRNLRRRFAVTMALEYWLFPLSPRTEWLGACKLAGKRAGL
jgi:hypothetical protein